MDGYVSFVAIEGLGIPEGSDEEADQDNGRGRWLQWLRLSGKASADYGRNRSENSSASR